MLAKEGSNYCSLSLVRQVEEMLVSLEGGYDSIIFAGHSLGGTSAFCLSKKFSNSRCVCVNPGAAPTNPIYDGPGRDKAVVYHIVGDIISTHMSENACNLYRVKLNGVVFGSVQAHSTENLYSNSGWSYWSATLEDDAFIKWVKGNRVVAFAYKAYAYLLKKAEISNPIPNSARDNK